MLKSVFIVSCLVGLIGCGKVAQDISEQSNKSLFKSIKLSTDLKAFKSYGWDALPSTQNAIETYVYGQGLMFGKGYEKIGFARAIIGLERIASKNVPVVTNYDLKKNVVTSSRYQQGFINLNLSVSENFEIKVNFNKIRPKYDYYSFVQYSSKDTYLFNIQADVPTKEIKVTPYTHLVSVLFLNHVKKESYNKETIIPMSEFYRIIPPATITSTSNIIVKNNVRKFKLNDPLFSLNSPYLDALLNLVNISYYSDKFDVEDYISSVESNVFPPSVKKALSQSINDYFLNKKSMDPFITSNAVESL